LLSTGIQQLYANALTWDEVRYGRIIQQELDNSCGLAALLTIMHFYFGDTQHSERSLLSLYIESTSTEELGTAMRDGLSLLELSDLAKQSGYKTRLYTLSKEELRMLVERIPVLVYLQVVEYRHFAVVQKAQERVTLADPSRGNINYSWRDFLNEWGDKTGRGYAMIMLPT